MNENTDQLAPRARSSGLVVRELEGEVLVYDLDRNQAHCLNGTAGLIWRLCDGHTTVEAMVRAAEQQIGRPVGPDLVWRALAQLGAQNLLEKEVSRPAGISRRQMIARVGAVAVAVPLITSITAPIANAATSCTDTRSCGSACTGSNQCCGCGGSTAKATCQNSVCCSPAGGSCSSKSDCCNSNANCNSHLCSA